MTILQGAYWHDILDQPRALRSTIEGLARRGSPDAFAERLRAPGARVVLTGMGSSLFALYPLHLAWLADGIDSAWVETAELLGSQSTLLARATVVLAVSQSGASAELVRLAGRRPPSARLWAVTNTPGSPLARAADDVIPTDAGPESTVACKTYLATLAALAWLEAGTRCSGSGPGGILDALRTAADAVESAQRDLVATVWNLGAALDAVTRVFLAGRGRSLASAWSGALIAKEAAGVPVEGMSGAALRHGPLEMCGLGTGVVLFEGEGETVALQRRLAGDLRAAGATVGWVSDHVESGVWRIPAGAASTGPIREALVTQWLSLALAARRGREAGRFQRATKVTTVE